MTARKYFEDFEEGFTFNFKVPALTAKEITDFASCYDPQRFHLDEDEAAKTHFGSLIASGFQTQLLCFLPFCQEILVNSFAVGAPGIDSLKWLRPWYPGEMLNGTVKLVSKRKSSKRTDRGYLEFALDAATNNTPIISMNWTVIMMTKGVLKSSKKTGTAKVNQH